MGLNKNDRAEVEKIAKENGYKRSSTDENRWVKDGKSHTISDSGGSGKVNGTHYNTVNEFRNSTKW